MIKALARLGWTVVRVSGSHHILAKPGCPPVTIPVKRARLYEKAPPGPSSKQAGVTEDEFFDVY